MIKDAYELAFQNEMVCREFFFKKNILLKK